MTMKKKYVRPSIVEFSIRTSHMLAASTGLTTTSTNADSSDGLSRGGSGFWDDEDE